MSKRSPKGSGTIYFREDRGKWCAQVITGLNPKNGKYIRKTIYGQTQSDVIKQKKKLESKIEGGMFLQPTSYTVATWMDQWLSMIKISVEPSTYNTYESICRIHIKPTLGKFKLEKLTGQQVQQLINEKYNPSEGSIGLSRRTVKYISQTLYAAMRKAKAQQLIIFNPAADIELPKNRARGLRKKAFTAEEMNAFLKGTKESPHYYLWLIAFTTGFRRGELLGLQWADVDFESSRITLSRQVLLEGNVLTVKSHLKTYNSAATVMVMPLVIETLKEYRLKQSEAFLKVGQKIEDTDFIFCSSEKNPLRPDSITGAFKSAVKRCSLRNELSLHGTRHTFATLSTNVGMNLTKLQQLMRHDDVTVTSEYIDKMQDESFRSEIQKINDSFTTILSNQTK